MLGILSAESVFAGGSFAYQGRRRRGLPGDRRPDGLQRRGRGLRLLARRQRQHEPGGPPHDRRQGRRSARHRHAGLRRQRPGLRGHPGRRPGHRAGAGAEGLADLLGAGHPGRQADHRRGAHLRLAGRRARPQAAARAVGRSSAERAERYFAEAGFASDQIVAKYQLNMRYQGQNWPLAFDMATTHGTADLSFIDENLGQRAIELFNARHIEEYGHVREGEIPEIVGVRLATSVDTPMPPVGQGFTAAVRRPRSPRPAAPTWAPATRRPTSSTAPTAARPPGRRSGDHRRELHHHRGLPGLEGPGRRRRGLRADQGLGAAGHRRASSQAPTPFFVLFSAVMARLVRAIQPKAPPSALAERHWDGSPESDHTGHGHPAGRKIPAVPRVRG